MLKLMALLFMLIDHIGYIFYPNSIVFSIIGRLALPIFAWELASGFKRTKNLKLYIIRILILGITSQFFYDLLFYNGYLNICFTFFISLIMIKIIVSEKHYLKKIIAVGILIYFAYGLNIEYGLYGLAIVLSFYFIENKILLILIQLMLAITSIKFMHYHFIQVFSNISIILIILLKKYNFKCNKILTYGFYPIHIIFLLLLKVYFISN